MILFITTAVKTSNPTRHHVGWLIDTNITKKAAASIFRVEEVDSRPL
jgi:hypothetical protein